LAGCAELEARRQREEEERLRLEEEQPSNSTAINSKGYIFPPKDGDVVWG